MVTEATKNQLKILFQPVVIIPFDKTKLDQSLDAYVKEHYPHEANEYFATFSPMGYIKGSKLVINNECIGDKIGKESIAVEVYGERREDGKMIEHDLFPRYTFVHSIVDLISDFGQTETTIDKFMGSRFAYNDRIVCNMRMILKEIGILATC